MLRFFSVFLCFFILNFYWHTDSLSTMMTWTRHEIRWMKSMCFNVATHPCEFRVSFVSEQKYLEEYIGKKPTIAYTRRHSCKINQNGCAQFDVLTQGEFSIHTHSATHILPACETVNLSRIFHAIPLSLGNIIKSLKWRKNLRFCVTHSERACECASYQSNDISQDNIDVRWSMK